MGLTLDDIRRLSPDAQKQIAKVLGDKRSLAKAAEKQKYHNEPTKRVMPNGRIHRFPSSKEATRYDELMLALKAGRIRNLKLQPEFTITEGFITAEGERIYAHRYKADFSYETENGCVVEDVKGGDATKTRDYRNNRKALAERGIFIREV